ncbi:hypothetical protein KAR91_44360 [Candidatus Pacearchaeota archaeon]|nr:hypothetical protein [Candidatus Pacearchaeota archaeon]
MKQRNKENGSKNDHWETPQYIYDFLESTIFKDRKYFDPCPLYSTFDGLNIEWKDYNYINPPYNRKDKEAFIKKAYEESLKYKLCVMLIPATTETDIFHNVIVPNAKVVLIRRRIKFKGHNSKGEYVTNKTGQSGSMFVIFGRDIEPGITTIELPIDIKPITNKR